MHKIKKVDVINVILVTTLFNSAVHQGLLRIVSLLGVFTIIATSEISKLMMKKQEKEIFHD